MTELEALKIVFSEWKKTWACVEEPPESQGQVEGIVHGLIERVKLAETSHDEKTDLIFNLFAEHTLCVPVFLADLEEYQMAIETSGLNPEDLVLEDVVAAVRRAADEVPEPGAPQYSLAIRSKTIQLLKEGS